MKQYLTLNNLKILTLLVGLIGTITLVAIGTDEVLVFGIWDGPNGSWSRYSGDELLSVHLMQIIPWQFRTIFFFWTPYFFVKILEMFFKEM